MISLCPKFYGNLESPGLLLILTCTVTTVSDLVYHAAHEICRLQLQRQHCHGSSCLSSIQKCWVLHKLWPVQILLPTDMWNMSSLCNDKWHIQWLCDRGANHTSGNNCSSSSHNIHSMCWHMHWLSIVHFWLCQRLTTKVPKGTWEIRFALSQNVQQLWWWAYS